MGTLGFINPLQKQQRIVRRHFRYELEYIKTDLHNERKLILNCLDAAVQSEVIYMNLQDLFRDITESEHFVNT